MPREIPLQTPPECTTPEGAQALENLMKRYAKQLVALGGDNLYTSPGDDYHTPKRIDR